MRPDLPAEAAAMVRRCAAAGLDLSAACRVGAYNRRVAPELRLDDLGDRGHLAVVLGNSRALWPRFVAALGADAGLRAGADPLDRWIERLVGQAATGLDTRYEVRFAHELPPRLVAMQRLAEVAGLAWLAPSHLSVHPLYGPWFALRAVVVLAVAGPDPEPAVARDPCGRCTSACVPLLQQAMAARQGPDTWRSWLAVRDACPLGREHRYGEAQLRYHYTKDPAVLAEAISDLARGGSGG